MGQSRSNVVKKKKRNWYFNGFFSYFAWVIHLQAKRYSYSCYIDRLHFICFDFPEKLCMDHISGRHNKNKPKEKHAESSEHPANRVPTSLYTSFISVDFEKSMPDSCTAFGCTNHRSTTSLQFYHIPSWNDILSKE